MAQGNSTPTAKPATDNSDALTASLAKGLGMTVEQVRSMAQNAAVQNQFDPWAMAGFAQTGVLYAGMTASTGRRILAGEPDPEKTAMGPYGTGPEIRPGISQAETHTGVYHEGKEITTTIQDQMSKLYDTPKPTLSKYKHWLWLAGYYGKTPLDQINMTTLTTDDFAAFGMAMTSAARYKAAGKNLTWQQVLQAEAQDPSAAKRTAAIVGAGDKTPPIDLSSPEAITAAANATAEKILGHKATSTDVSTVIALIHEREMAYGKAHIAGAGGTAITPDAATEAASMENYFRDKYPNEATAVDWSAQATQWDQLLAAPPLPAPRQVGEKASIGTSNAR